MQQALNDYTRIANAIRYLDEHLREQPELKQVAAQAGLSEYHFQRLFTRWAGVSPKRFLQYLTAVYAGELLERRTVLDTALDSGLSGPGRLHDLMVTVHGVTPGELKRRGAGLTIRYGTHPTPFGLCLMALTSRGICALYFIQPDQAEEQLEELGRRWAGAEWVRDYAAVKPLLEVIFSRSGQLSVDLLGTNFQLKVWEALLGIPPGRIAFYEDVARAIGAPEATRAVASAIGRNPVSLLIPCHRVIRKTGAFGGYRWGLEKKRAMLAWEAAGQPIRR
jgi:AraC family transcriptional regulator, regulatory protein of adaptative response / methylated-DNA-[protein]-cysteine methyltransferase